MQCQAELCGYFEDEVSSYCLQAWFEVLFHLLINVYRSWSRTSGRSRGCKTCWREPYPTVYPAPLRVSIRSLYLVCLLFTECTLRLWDTYFSSEEGWDLHIYVCLAILRQCSVSTSLCFIDTP